MSVSPKVARALTLGFVASLLLTALVFSPTARAETFFIGSETLVKGSSDGFANEQQGDGFVNVKTEGGTSTMTPVTLYPNADLLNEWSEAPCQTDPIAWDDLDEDPADGEATCRRVTVPDLSQRTVTTAMQDLVDPPGVIEDYDVAPLGRVRWEGGDDALLTVAASDGGTCGGFVGGTTSSAYVDVTFTFTTCDGVSEWTKAQIDSLRVSSVCGNDIGLADVCRATQHKAVVNVTHRSDYHLNFTSRFVNVQGPKLFVRWDCTTTDTEGLDLYVDGTRMAQGVCASSISGNVRIPDIGAPRSVDVLLASPTTAGDTTPSAYAFDLLKIETLNTPPAANAGPDQTVPKKTLVTLDGSLSSDADGEAVTFRWTQVAGPAVTLSNPTTAAPTFTPALSGTYVFVLTVEDGFGGADSDFVVVTATNAGPTANAGPDQTVPKNTLVSLDGNGSSDPDADALTFRWTQRLGPSVALAGDDTATPTFTPPLPGTYAFLLVATDVDNASAEDTVVVNATNASPAADAGVDQAAPKKTTVALNGTASADPDLDGLAFAWAQTAGPTVILTGADTSSPTFVPPVSGVYEFELAVSDGFGGVSLDRVQVTATNGNPIANAGADQVVAKKNPVTLDGTASSDPDVDAISFAWTQVSGPIVTLVGADTASPSFVPNVGGLYVFRMTVGDGDGGSASDTVQVTATNGNPAANAGADQVVVKKSAVTLNGSTSSDPNGDGLAFAWIQLAGLAVILAGADTPTPTFTPARAGLHVFALTVRDGDGGLSTDVVQVTATNGAPVASAGPDVLAPKLTPVALDGRGSSDPNGDGISFRWTQAGGPSVALSDPTSDVPTFTPTLPGVYTFLLTVDDGDGGIASDVAIVTVWSRDPVASLTALPTTVRVNVDVAFSGVGSGDPDGTIVDYAFDFGDGNAVRGALAAAFHPYLVPGTFVATLTVRDDDGNESTVQVTITVTANAAPQADPRVWPADAGFIGTRFVFAGGNSTDDMMVAGYTWDFGDGTSGVGSVVAHDFRAKGQYTVVLTVTDGDGSTDTAPILVTIGNRAPFIKNRLATGATLDLTTAEGFNFVVVAEDPDGDALTYTWRVGGLVVGTDAPYHAFSSSSAGSFIVNVTVTDGVEAQSAEWTVDVTAPPAPVAAFPWDLVVLVLIIVALSLLLLRRSLGPRATPSSREGRGRAVEGEEEGAEEEKETDLPDDADDLLGAGDRDEDEERDEDKL